MRRSRIMMLIVAVAALVVGSIAVMSPANAQDGYQLWVNRGSGMCLTATGGEGSAVIQAACATPGLGVQKWTAECADWFCDEYVIRNLGTNMCLDAQGGATNGTPAVLWPCNYISNEIWKQQRPWSVFPNLISLRSQVAGTNNRCLDVPKASTAPGVQLEIYECNGSNAQLFTTRNP